MSDATSPPAVGAQLAKRREDLDMTQDELAVLIAVRTRTISAIERGENTIQRGKRSAWENALRLESGTIRRAYDDGIPVASGFLDQSATYEAPSPRAMTAAEMTRRILRLEERVFGQESPPAEDSSARSRRMIAETRAAGERLNAPPEPETSESDDRNRKAAG